MCPLRRGALILDTKTRRMRVMKNFKVDESIVHVRELPERVCGYYYHWGSLRAEGPSDSPHRGWHAARP